jgi:hypothetical protein
VEVKWNRNIALPLAGSLIYKRHMASLVEVEDKSIEKFGD